MVAQASEQNKKAAKVKVTQKALEKVCPVIYEQWLKKKIKKQNS